MSSWLKTNNNNKPRAYYLTQEEMRFYFLFNQNQLVNCATSLP